MQTEPNPSYVLTTLCCSLADDKKAEQLLVLDLQEVVSSPANYFVICTVNSETQARAVADSIISTSKSYGIQAPRSEGFESSQWIIVDFFDVVVHILLQEQREFYKIEKVWGDGVQYSYNHETTELEKISKPPVTTVPTTTI